MVESLEQLIFLIPGFATFISVHWFYQSEKQDVFHTTLWSLLFSLIIFGVLDYFQKLKLFDLRTIDWRLISAMMLVYLLLTIFCLLFLKMVLPWLERKTQLFDRVKSSREDVLSDVLADVMKTTGDGVWLHIVTKDNLSYTGYIRRQGLLKDGNAALYLLQPKAVTEKTKFNVENIEGMLIPIENIYWMGIIKKEWRKTS